MKSFFLLSLAQKYLTALTGLGLALFLLLHMLGNMFIFLGAKAYNLYAHQLETDWLVFFEIVLLAFFLLHIALAIFLSIQNKRARPQAYAKNISGFKGTAWYQKTLLIQGAVIFVFVVLHLIIFKFGTRYEVVYEGQKVRDLFRLVVETFQNPLIFTWYLTALLILFFHLFHGLQSAYLSLGFDSSRWTSKLKIINWCYAGFVIVGFISQPLYIFFFLKEIP